jgi:purine nucleoside permease
VLYRGFPLAQSAPGVAIGGSLSTERFWVGVKMAEWANRWMFYMTDNRSDLVTTAQNDIGSLVALASLGRAGRADPDRGLLLRTTRNFDRLVDPSALPEFLAKEQHGAYTGYDAALAVLYQVGAPVVHRLMQGD